MASHLRLVPMALFVAVAFGCVDQKPTIPPVTSRPVTAEIAGSDSDGKEIKLSDYRGKVVLVDFWRDTCPPCRENHIHERRLLEKYADKPFAILGVNVHIDRATQRRSEKEQKLSWPSIWDGHMHENTHNYSVMYLPSVFLFDHKGRLAKTFDPGLPNSRELENDIERLLDEAKKDPVQAD